ncbi:MAG: hypothetical protein HON90_04155 [Halobacteriovoraceae bacterium]|jgi:hypothetical protein|nr:hypothetical protein [Halobacteriovoraceae bacterium]
MGITFRRSDFEQVYFSFIFVNQTSGIECKNYKKIKVEEFLDDGIIMVVPTNSCNVRHNLMVLVFKGSKPRLPKIIPAEGRGKGIRFSAIGKVENKEINEKDTTLSSIKLKFVQFDKFGWQDFVDIYREKQEEITSTFIKLKINED